jgi:hypothetical protein
MKHKQPAGAPMTLGNMRELGVQRLIPSCLILPAQRLDRCVEIRQTPGCEPGHIGPIICC